MFLKLVTLLLLLACKVSFGHEPPLHIESRTPSQIPESNRYRNVAYYVNWAVYGRHFFPQELPADKLTHVLYAFANINPNTGEVFLSDPWADTDIHFAGDSKNDVGTNLYGCLKQLYILKKQNRNLKVLLSIGGWTYSSNFEAPAATISGRSTFASSAVSLIRNLGLDGLDIDWEYPADNIQADNFVLLLETVRAALEVYSKSLSTAYHFELTVACPASPSNYEKLHLAEMNQYIDFWNLMAYDYAGPWSTETSHQANLFYADDKSTPFNTQTTVSYYISQGIAASKIVLGMPIYGRAFNKTKGLGLPYSGVSPGTWEEGVYDFKALPLRGATEFFDNKTGASYSYDTEKEEFISYDNIAVARQKAAWIQKMGLGGAMWWESSADATGSKGLIGSVSEVLGGEDGSDLEGTPNELSYLNTPYANLRAGMPDPSFGSELVSASTATSAPLTTSSPTFSMPTGPVLSKAFSYGNISLNFILTITSTVIVYSIIQSTSIDSIDISSLSTSLPLPSL